LELSVKSFYVKRGQILTLRVMKRLSRIMLMLLHPLGTHDGRGDPFLRVVWLNGAHRRLALARRKGAVRTHRHGRQRCVGRAVAMVDSERGRQEGIQAGAESRCRISRGTHKRRHLSEESSSTLIPTLCRPTACRIQCRTANISLS